MFLEFLNNLHPNLQFTTELGPRNLAFCGKKKKKEEDDLGVVRLMYCLVAQTECSCARFSVIKM